MDTLRDHFNNCNQSTQQNPKALVSLSSSVGCSVYNDIDYEMDLLVERRKWLSHQPSFNELLHIFPEAKAIAKRETKRQINELKIKVAEFVNGKDVYIEQALANEKPRYHNSIIQGIDDGYERATKKLNDRVRSLEIRLLSLSGKLAKGQLDISKAKQASLSSIITIGRDHKAKCVWHNERTASMHCYKNKVHCFGCGKSGDVIDVYMAVHGVDFKNAVQALQ